MQLQLLKRRLTSLRAATLRERICPHADARKTLAALSSALKCLLNPTLFERLKGRRLNSSQEIILLKSRWTKAVLSEKDSKH